MLRLTIGLEHSRVLYIVMELRLLLVSDNKHDRIMIHRVCSFMNVHVAQKLRPLILDQIQLCSKPQTRQMHV